MAKEVKTFIIDLEISDEGSYEPGETPPVHGEVEFLEILRAGCAAHNFTVAEVSSNTLMSRSYSEKLYELVEQ